MIENKNAKKHEDSTGLRYARYKIPIANINALENTNPQMIPPKTKITQVIGSQCDVLFFIIWSFNYSVNINKKPQTKKSGVLKLC